LTATRQLVFELLHKYPSGAKAYDLLNDLRALKPNASPPTVYRALDFLVANGLARKIHCISMFIVCHNDEGKQSIPKLLLVCPHCAGMRAIEDNQVLAPLINALIAQGYRPDHQGLEIGAVCPSCDKSLFSAR
tara:strand:+ start:838 stop:1236 length:399 start_codon:yes stop_codon:yes gene_type:complete